MRTKNQGPDLEANTKFKGQCSNLEGYTFDTGPRALDNYTWKMNELDQYLGETYIDSSQPAITAKTPSTSPDPEMPTIIPDTGVKHNKNDANMTYLEKKNIYQAIRKKPIKKYVYENDMHKI